MQTLRGHNVTPGYVLREDAVDFSRSRPVADDQRWIITDAPGFWSAQVTERNVYHKRFTVTVTVEETHVFEYEARVEVDAIGGLVDPESPTASRCLRLRRRRPSF